MMPQATALAETAEPGKPRQADIVVGIPAGSAGGAEEQVAARVRAELQRLSPSRSATVLFLARRGHGEVEAVPALGGPAPEGRPGTGEPPSPASGAFLGPASALPALLREAKRLDAPLCALVAPVVHDDSADWVRLLLGPILDEGYDFVCPSYLRGKFEGTINNGIVYPLTRALYGRRLRQPLGGEVALSRKLAASLLEDEEWQTDPMHAGADVWLVTKVLSREFRLCQAFLGRAPEAGSEPPLDLSEILSRILSLLFHEMERHAATWQRIAGSEPVPTFGVAGILAGESHPVNVSRMVDAFELGHQDLRDLWSVVLPPATLLALKRVTRQPSSSFRIEDDLWARIVYDFALGHHMRLMDRTQMLRSMTPIYLGWVASFVNEVRDLGGPETEERIERLCRAFEEAKPYLISRWRWPDRFNP